MPEQQSGLVDFILNDNPKTDLDDGIDESDTEKILFHHFIRFKQYFIKVNREKEDLIPIPASSKVIIALFEAVFIEVAERIAGELNAHLTESNSRQYPDVNLRNAFGNNLTALDFKGTRIKDSATVSGMTLGGCRMYFSNPEDSTGDSNFPYRDYDQHWVVCFAYKWDESKESENMVTDVETLVGRKWEFAAAPPPDEGGANSTNQITSQTDLRSLRNRNPYFDSRREFGRQWRKQGND